jgi:hypothetical protein
MPMAGLWAVVAKASFVIAIFFGLAAPFTCARNVESCIRFGVHSRARKSGASPLAGYGRNEG